MLILSQNRWHEQMERSAEMKFISIIQTFGHALTEPGDDQDGWLQDPLSHPDLQAMSLRELADLPFNRGTRALPGASEECARC
jgi:hypothetical protein